MAPKLDHMSAATTIDLTGLPEPVIEEVQRIVQEARQQQADPVDAPNGVPHPTPTYISDPNPSLEEFKRLLDRMASRGTGITLPADFSRADLYDDHD